jgi:signal transduction histidine kinase
MGRQRIKIDLLIHDLKVPLAVIEAGIVSMMKRRDKYGPLTKKQEKVMNRALRNTKKTLAIVNDAMELARSSSGINNPRDFRISSLVKQSLIEVFDLTDDSVSDEIRGCGDLGGLKLELMKWGLQLNIDDELWNQEFCLDLQKVNQILRNLLNNAMKYRKKEVALTVNSEKGFLNISVKDDGDGISRDYHEKIFECYFQLDANSSCPVRGHGLGLAGVMVLVEDMGGELVLESDEGKGAEFLVKVPLDPA